MSGGLMRSISNFFSGGKSRKRKGGGGVADNAALVKGGKAKRNRKIRGGIYGQDVGGVADNAGLWNAKEYGQDSGPSLNLLATNYGGKSRRRRRK